MDLLNFLNAYQDRLRKIILSSSEKKTPIAKVTYTLIQLQNTSVFQRSTVIQNQAFHENMQIDNALIRIYEEFQHQFRQIVIQFDNEEHQWIRNGNKIKKRVIQKKNKLEIQNHNRIKNHFYQESKLPSFLFDCGITDLNGKIKPKMQSKFNQINKFLEICHKSIEIIRTKTDSIHVVDIGCGKGYLTFALYDLLKSFGFKKIYFVGLDLKQQVVEKNETIVKKYQMDGLKFICADAKDYTFDLPIDIVIALHACDIATDIAIDHAVRWKAQAIFLAPCCHQFLFSQIENDNMQALLKHGILKERFSALLTDALRSSYLENQGYQVDVIEFVDREDSLKNIMIKAFLTNKSKLQNLKQFQNLKSVFNLTPYLKL